MKIFLLFLYFIFIIWCQSIELCENVRASGDLNFRKEDIVVDPNTKVLKKRSWVTITSSGDLLADDITYGSMSMSIYKYIYEKGVSKEAYLFKEDNNLDMSMVRKDSLSTLNEKQTNFTLSYESSSCSILFYLKRVGPIKMSSLAKTKDVTIPTGHFSFTFRQYVYPILTEGDYRIRTTLYLNDRIAACIDYWVTIKR